jgi:hypothetical protein
MGGCCEEGRGSLMFQVSGFRFQVLGFRFQVSKIYDEGGGEGLVNYELRMKNYKWKIEACLLTNHCPRIRSKKNL